MTITKTTNRAKDAIRYATDIRCYSLSNGFIGQPLTEKPIVWSQHKNTLIEISQASFLMGELMHKSSKLTVDENGRYCIHVHSNLWYEFTQKPEPEFDRINISGPYQHPVSEPVEHVNHPQTDEHLAGCVSCMYEHDKSL